MQNSKLLTVYSPDYPLLLNQIHAAPPLFYKGSLSPLTKPCLSIVGTRKNSDYGEFITEKLISELANYDITIVSGLAKGIDTIAHKSALANNLDTIAVLGCGIDYIYPAENTALAAEILEKNGLILSEFPAMTEAVKTNFPRRNRIISGLSVATIVIEAPEKSGALITAKFALEQNRDVFVVPGDVDRLNSIGNLRILQRGEGYPISSAADLMEILQQQPSLFHKKIKPIKYPKITPQKTEKPLQPINYKITTNQQKILELIPIHRVQTLEKIAEKCRLPISQLLIDLSILEIHGLIQNLDGKYTRR